MVASFQAFAIGAVILAFWTTVCAEGPSLAKMRVTIREHRQKVTSIPQKVAGQHRRVLFAPGDGGCRGFASYDHTGGTREGRLRRVLLRYAPAYL